MPQVLALIPARSGSKGISHKNITPFHGKPLLAHSVAQALGANTVDRVIVSTDSELYAAIAREHGAEVPFLRPAEISGDYATDHEAFVHALRWLEREEGYRPDLCVHLRPTYPHRSSADIDRAVELLLSDPGYDSVRSVVEAPEPPYKMWLMDEAGTLSPVATCEHEEAYNLPRQILPMAYLQNASIDVVRSSVILERGSMTGDRIRGMLMEHLHDIDHSDQLEGARAAHTASLEGKRIVVDIDGVLASLTPANDYAKSEPLVRNIETVNMLHDAGCTIILFTARGYMTGLDWEVLTQDQMKRWGVRYHELHFGKPAGSYYVDDRFIALEQLRSMVERA